MATITMMTPAPALKAVIHFIRRRLEEKIYFRYGM